MPTLRQTNRAKGPSLNAAPVTRAVVGRQRSGRPEVRVRADGMLDLTKHMPLNLPDHMPDNLQETISCDHLVRQTISQTVCHNIYAR